MAVVSSHATPGHVLRSELASAAADLRDLPWGTSASRVRFSLARNFRGQPLAIDASAVPQRQEPAPLEQPRPPQRITTTAPKFEDNIPTPANNITTPPKA